MANLLLFFQIITALILSVFILVQVRGTGLGRVWGKELTSFSRRGLEGLIFKLTFVLAFLFILASVLQMIAF